MTETSFFRSIGTTTRVVVTSALLVLSAGATAKAQDNPNQGAISFSGGIDLLPGTTYVFRGIVQESDPKLTLWPYGEVGFTLVEGDGGVQTAGLSFGVWNSLHTGSSGSDGPGKLHYEEDFYVGLSLAFDRGVTLDTTYTAYTSPNNSFATVNELSFNVAVDHMLAPYGLLAFELGDDGQADGGAESGTYLELGIGPSYSLIPDGPELTIPVKLGLSLSNYYENPFTGEDEKFGFFSVGASVSVPLAAVPARFGQWEMHAGADILLFGDTTEAFNNDDNVKGVFLVGLGLSY